MHASERMIAATEAAVAHEAACGIAGVRARLLGHGAAACIDCGDAIERARRAAMPNARRCVDCQGVYESGRNGY